MNAERASLHCTAALLLSLGLTAYMASQGETAGAVLFAAMAAQAGFWLGKFQARREREGDGR